MTDIVRRHWGKLLLLALLAGGLASVPFMLRSAHAPTAAAPAQYVCPMHPEIHQDGPGRCPKCGMDLVQKAAALPSAQYVCPMHPEIHQDGPGRCPKCGMDLVKTEATPVTSTSGAANVEGLAPVQADAARAGLAGIRTVEVSAGEITTTVRAVGTVSADETRVRQVTSKIGGWVEKLSVNAVGQFVRAGDPLFDLYSPELLVSQEEYVRAKRAADEFGRSTLPEVRRGGEELATAARRRLELFDVPANVLDRLDRTGAAQRTITFRAPFGGHVTEKMVLEGQRIDAGMPLMTVTDLSTVWVIAQVYENESADAVAGRVATLSPQYDTGVRLRGRISLVYPTIDVESRTIRVRFEVPNPRLALKPGMFVNVELDARRARGLVVPDSALIDTGTRQIVFVEASPGQFEPREVTVGPRSAGQVVVNAGLTAGERVAVSATFLLDSESRLRAAIVGTPARAAAPAK